MRLDKLTIKTQEAVQDAVEIARSHENQAIEPAHVLRALIAQEDGVVRPMLQKLGANVSELQEKFVNIRRLRALSNRMPAMNLTTCFRSHLMKLAS